ncbi:Unknown protein sequence [Pseudomonas coronafaciens pv. oryzae]|nr:Unknown protein sequence [Pseudomonas coronafaciens pv. oryzae]
MNHCGADTGAVTAASWAFSLAGARELPASHPANASIAIIITVLRT